MPASTACGTARTGALVALAFVMLAGCAQRARVRALRAAPPTLRTEVSYFVGSPLSGPVQPDASSASETESGTPDATTTPPAFDPQGALRVTCDVLWLPGDPPPRGALDPLASRGRLIFRTRGGDPLRASPTFSERALAGLGDEAMAAVRMGERASGDRLGEHEHTTDPVDLAFLTAALSEGITADFRFGTDRRIEERGFGSVRRTVDIEVSRAEGSGAPTVAIIVDDFAYGTGDDGGEGENGGTGDDRDDVAVEFEDDEAILQNEIVLLDEPLPTDGTPFVFCVQPPFAPGTFVAILRATEPPLEGGLGEAHARVARHAERILADRLLQARALRRLDVAERTRQRAYATAARSLTSPQRRRDGLVHLAAVTGASLTLDLALVAPDDNVDAYVQRLLSSNLEMPDRSTLRDLSIAPEEARDVQAREIARLGRPRLGVLLEAHALDYLAGEMSAERLPPSLDALAVEHCGEIGRFASLMRDLAHDDPRSIERLYERLVEENVAFLSDARPSARVRAFDWLRARGLAPAGYEPLGDRAGRRRALQDYERSGADIEAGIPPATEPGR